MNEHTFFEWKRSERLTAVLALVFCLLGLGLQRLPGVGFSGKLSWGLALVCLVLLGLSRLSRRHRGWKILLRIAQIGLAALVLGLSAVEVWVIRAGHRDESAQPADAVIVLGAGVTAPRPPWPCKPASTRRSGISRRIRASRRCCPGDRGLGRISPRPGPCITR